MDWNEMLPWSLAMGHEVRGLHVPIEIFAEIFVLCLPTARFTAPSLTAAPLAVSGVCHRWRQAALATPELWNSLSLDAKWVTPDSSYVEFCTEWISRAGSLPLSLSLKATESPYYTNTLLNLVRELSPQWQDVELDLGAMKQIMTFPPGDYRLLEKISIVPPSSGLLVSFQNAPKLREAELVPYTGQVQFPRRQLTAFSSQHLDVAAFFGLLREAPNLVHATFRILYCEPSALPTTGLVLPQLQSLALASSPTPPYIGYNIVPMAILDVLQTPALKSLTLSFPFRARWPMPHDNPHFLSFVSRSSFQLHTLALSLMPVPTPTLMECLRVLPSLVHFKLEPLYLEQGTFFAQLVDRDLVPHLESLHLIFPFSKISQSIVTPTGIPTVVEMLCARWNAGAGLQSFRLAYEDNSWLAEALTLQPGFRRLEEEGMALYVGKVDKAVDKFVLESSAPYYGLWKPAIYLLNASRQPGEQSTLRFGAKLRSHP
ncbi:hypothetical protein DFH08DRAFT_955373 [Mycena albidolilacea]|uniref:F-box domain-containing protein n=1 Tax=Mycena albidolilacea TaxID=1033008 RepID=A0AAD7EX68_9AGAR|nr:hypothetical protein DFH08DRAFT_955373 [Mycena albidolilacea]